MTQRSPAQNDMIHPIFREVASELMATGSEVKISLSPSPESMKEYFIQEYLHGKRTSQASKEELSKAFELFLEAMNLYLVKFKLGPVMVKDKEAIKYILNQLNNDN